MRSILGVSGAEGSAFVFPPLNFIAQISASRVSVSSRAHSHKFDVLHVRLDRGVYARNMPSITSFIDHHYRHFNAAALVDAAKGYNTHLASGGKTFMTIAGAMSTAELGLSLAEMIRQDKVHGICCTGANLEEDVFNLVAHNFYERVPNYRDLTPADEAKLLSRHMNRVTDTCIPEMEAMRRIENEVLKEWVRADQAGERFFPHEFFFKVLCSGSLGKRDRKSVV